MISKRKLLNRARLYLILDRSVHDYRRLFEIARQAVLGGVDILQLRDKQGQARDILDFSRKMIPFARKHQALYIINDRVDLTLLAGACGVHVGQGDISCDQARRLLGKKFLVGVSCQTLAHVRKAETAGADYIGFGSVFKTQTKPERNPMRLSLLKNVLRKTDLPVFPIGGITLANLPLIQKAGASRAAVCRGISLADCVKSSVKEFKKVLEKKYVATV